MLLHEPFAKPSSTSPNRPHSAPPKLPKPSVRDFRHTKPRRVRKKKRIRRYATNSRYALRDFSAHCESLFKLDSDAFLFSRMSRRIFPSSAIDSEWSGK